jgi:hypothetical protein
VQEPAVREAAEKEACLQEFLEQIRQNDEPARYHRYTGRSLDNGDDRGMSESAAGDRVEPHEAPGHRERGQEQHQPRGSSL